MKSISLKPIAVLALLSAAAPLATDMYLPALPVMSEHLATSAAKTQLTLTTFFIGMALGQLFIGPLSDRFGRRKPLLLGTALLAVSCVFCAIATDISVLIIARLLQGFGGGVGMVLARAIITDKSKTATESARLFQIMVMISGIAPILAPSLGAVVISFSGWRGVFVVLTLCAVIALIGAWLLLPESLAPEKRTSLGFTNLARISKEVVSSRRYSLYTLTVGFTALAMFSYISSSPFIFQGILGLSQNQYAIAFGVNAIGLVLMGCLSAKLLDRFSAEKLAAIGLGMMLFGCILICIAVVCNAGAMFILPCVFITVAPIAFVLGNASSLAINEMRHVAGTASAILGAVQFSLGGLASPLVGMFGENTATPMAFLMLITTMLACLCFFASTKRPKAVA